MRFRFLLAFIVLVLARIPFSQPDVQYAELVPQIIFDNADPDCQSFITYAGTGEPEIQYYIWDSKSSKEHPAYSGDATCIGQSWSSGKACHSGFFNPQPLSGVISCAIEASAHDEISGKCALAARACQDCPEGCGDGKCTVGETTENCPQDCVFYGPEIRVLSPECYLKLYRGERFPLKISIRKGGAPLKGATVSASGFFGTVSLLDDGKNEDGVAGDGIYTATSAVPSSSLGVLPVKFTVKIGESLENRGTLAWVVSGLMINAKVGGTQKLGDIVFVNGSVSSLGKPANGTVTVEFYSPSGKLALAEKSAFANGSYSFSYHGTLTDELGNWTITANATDEFGNSGAWSGGFSMVKLSPGSFLEVEHLSPVSGAYARGTTVSVSAKVKRDGQPFSNAKVFFISPEGKPVEMKEVGNGIYGAPFTIAESAPLGVWPIIVRASAETDAGKIEGGSSYKASIVSSEIRVEITRPDRAEFGVGDTVEVVAIAKYSGGEAVNATLAYTVIGNDKVHMEQTQPGVFVAYYTIPESMEGGLMLSVGIEDSFGNSGSKNAMLTVSGTSLLYTLDKNRFIVIPAAIAVIIGLFTLCKNCIFASKKDRLLKRKEQLLALQAKLQEQYLKQGSIDRKTFYDMSAKYDSELQRIEHDLAEMEEKKGEAEKK